MTPEQKRRHEDEQRRLRRQRDANRGGSMSYYVDKSDAMVEAFQPSQDSCGSDTSSDGGGSCD